MCGLDGGQSKWVMTGVGTVPAIPVPIGESSSVAHVPTEVAVAPLSIVCNPVHESTKLTGANLTKALVVAVKRCHNFFMTAFLLVLVAAVLTTMLLGVHLFGPLVLNRVMADMDAATYIRVKQLFDEYAPRFAKPVMLGSIFTTLAATIASLWFEARVAVLCGIALIALVITLLSIVRGDLPINRMMAGWSPNNPPEEWRLVRARWERFFRFRTVSNAVATPVLLIAVVDAAMSLS